MARVKSKNLTIRISPSIKEALRGLAEKERRSVGNLIEVLVIERCEKAGLQVSSEPAPTGKDMRQIPRRKKA